MSDTGWSNELPHQEGFYLMDTGAGEPKKVYIRDLQIDSDPERPRKFHVLEDSDGLDGDQWYALNQKNYGRCRWQQCH